MSNDRLKGTYYDRIESCGIVVGVGVCGLNVDEGLADYLREVFDGGFVKRGRLNSRETVNEPVYYVNTISINTNHENLQVRLAFRSEWHAGDQLSRLLQVYLVEGVDDILERIDSFLRGTIGNDSPDERYSCENALDLHFVSFCLVWFRQMTVREACFPAKGDGKQPL